ncbi:MAG TPA: glycosyltransferase [Thermoleophilaceae bacterium]|nr:glycosyltransferase [Thermoleophilaceae bacterium]
MRVCVVAEYYPRRRDPVLGVWAHRQALAARDAGAEVRVLVLERPVPPVSAFKSARRLGRALAGAATQPRHDTLDGLDLEYVRFVSPPRERSYTTWDRWARAPLGRALTKLHADWPLDLVHAHYALPAAAAALAFSEEEKLPLAVSVHGGDVLGPLVSTPQARARVSGVLRRSSVVLCNSRDTLIRCSALTGSTSRMCVVHLGAEAPADPPAKRAEPTIATLGHVVGRKRHVDVLHALTVVTARVPDARWVVIGDGPERPALQRLAHDLGVADRIDWLGQLPPDEALRELSRCHVMAMPSLDEAFGVAYVEALACGLPAIGCAGEGGPEEIAGLGAGMLLVPPRDPDALAEEVARLLTDSARLTELSAAARDTAAREFSWERCGRATVQAYERAIEEGPR